MGEGIKIDYGTIFQPEKSADAYKSRKFSLTSDELKRINEVLWQEHPVGHNPENYNLNTEEAGQSASVTFNSAQIEADFLDIAKRLSITLT